jgi:transcriptional regulator with XRE-family HTH domain
MDTPDYLDPNKNFKAEFAIWFRNQLEEKGITRHRLADLTGISTSQVDRYYYAENRPREVNARKIAQALGISEKEIFEIAEIDPSDYAGLEKIFDDELRQTRRFSDEEISLIKQCLIKAIIRIMKK